MPKRKGKSVMRLIWLLTSLLLCASWWSAAETVPLLWADTGVQIKLLITAGLCGIWFLGLLRWRSRVLFVLSVGLVLFPAVFAAVVLRVFPSMRACWFQMLACGVWLAVHSCTQVKSALSRGAAAAALLALAAVVSIGIGSRLEPVKAEKNGNYQKARVYVQETALRNLETAWEAWKESGIFAGRTEDEQAADERAADDQAADEQAERAQEEKDAGQGEENQSETVQEAAGQPDEDRVNVQGLENLQFENPGDAGMQGPLGGGSTDMEDLRALEYFQPRDERIMTVTVEERPAKTVYLPVSYGKNYDGGGWSLTEDEEGTSSSYEETGVSLERLEELCRTADARTAAGAEAFIREVLEENTRYDPNPGGTPDGRDFAEYFLFENQRGFCVHFATTAALMYRLMGYPSRYTEGYAVPASAFERTENGYQAEVTAAMGHAWCETYSEYSGWTIREHTLEYTASVQNAASGQDSPERSLAGQAGEILRIVLGGGGLVLAVLLCIWGQAALRRGFFNRRLRRGEPAVRMRLIYRRLYEMAKLSGMQAGDPLSGECAEEMKRLLGGLSDGEWSWIYAQMLCLTFYEIEDQTETAVRMCRDYKECAKACGRSLGRGRRLMWRYMYAFP